MHELTSTSVEQHCISLDIDDPITTKDSVYKIVNLSLDIHVCDNFNSPHTSYSLTTTYRHIYVYKFSCTIMKGRSVHVYISCSLSFLAFIPFFSLLIAVVRA